MLMAVITIWLRNGGLKRSVFSLSATLSSSARGHKRDKSGALEKVLAEQPVGALVRVALPREPGDPLASVATCDEPPRDNATKLAF
jgi:hypothetical protein